MNTKIVLAFVCVSVGVISAFPYPGKKILRTGLFKLLSKRSALLCEWPIESIGKCFVFFPPAFAYEI